ncbi:glycosyltransferase family 25 protein [Parahaliea sp. F7430]|uniref:Glycosyltransferase family 25 protein n=1 Tax=Sediminihaliea albiluteola TaxID=2758564 RepID=A0A7W2TY26_9GAMM|nr:glycosyltransferase family 25 protein [Sediminihaliea albiluteola]MBA6414061.1 glycosyltransferase family 25 protein [Sediminihaliea albiluteola]
MVNLVPWTKSNLKVDDVPVAIVSLDDASNRRSTLIKRGFDSELVEYYWPACDMRNISACDLRTRKEYFDFKNTYKRPPIPAELGCFFSHSQIIKWFTKQNSPSQLIIFEDDVIPSNPRAFKQLADLASCLSEAAYSGHTYILHLGVRPEQLKLPLLRRISKKTINVPGLQLFDLADKTSEIWRSHAYIISKSAAIKYQDVTHDTVILADDWRFIMNTTKCKLLIAQPALFTQIDPSLARQSESNFTFYSDKYSIEKSAIFNSIANTAALITRQLCRRVLALVYSVLPYKRLF